jgi:hypothetical protein
MSEPERLNRSTGLAGALLLSAKTDKAPAGASRRLLAGAAVGAALAAKSSAIAAPLGGMGSALGHVARWATWKWVALGLAGVGSVATVKVALTARENARARTPGVEASPLVTREVARPAPARSLPARSLPVRAAPEPPPSVAPALATAAPAPPVLAPPAPAARVVMATLPAVTPPAPLAPATAAAALATPTSHLALEIVAIDGAKRTLAAGDAAAVLAKMDAYDAAFPQGMLAAEANALRIEALVRLGRRDDARAELGRFRAKHPGSPLLESLTRVVGD